MPNRQPDWLRNPETKDNHLVHQRLLNRICLNDTGVNGQRVNGKPLSHYHLFPPVLTWASCLSVSPSLRQAGRGVVTIVS